MQVAHAPLTRSASGAPEEDHCWRTSEGLSQHANFPSHARHQGGPGALPAPSPPRPRSHAHAAASCRALLAASQAALHAQGGERDATWLRSRLEPCTLHGDERRAPAPEATGSPRMRGGGGGRVGAEAAV